VPKRNCTQKSLFLYWVNQTKIGLELHCSKLIWHQTEFCPVLNRSEKFSYNPNLVWFKKIQNRLIWACNQKNPNDSWEKLDSIKPFSSVEKSDEMLTLHSHWLSERLAYLGIKGHTWGPLFRALDTIKISSRCGEIKALIRGVSWRSSVGPPWCRETLISRTAIRLIHQW